MIITAYKWSRINLLNEYLINGKKGNYQLLTENKEYALRTKTKSQLFSALLDNRFFSELSIRLF